MIDHDIVAGLVYRHHSGRFYKVVVITNTSHESDQHPVTVVYSGPNGHMWSRPLTGFIDNFTIAAADELPTAADVSKCEHRWRWKYQQAETCVLCGKVQQTMRAHSG